MNKYVAFIRGVNVGGITLTMYDLKKIFAGLGFKNIQSYIQSGNIVFESDETDTTLLGNKIQESIQKKTKLSVVVFIKTNEQIRSLVSNTPFGKNFDANRIYVIMMNKTPIAEKFEGIKSGISAGENFILKKDVIYSYYGNGYGKSKHTNNYFEKVLSVSATTRNWNTINKIFDLMNAE